MHRVSEAALAAEGMPGIAESVAREAEIPRLSDEAGLRRLALATIGLREARAALRQRRGWNVWDQLTEVQQDAVRALAEQLAAREVRMLLPIDAAWPTALQDLSSPPVYLFAWGNLGLLEQPAIGMCGSRSASDRGLEAARVCGREVAKHGMHVVSGYARGVDTATHLAALDAGAGTVIVLAEGILHFKVKQVFCDAGITRRNVLVLSQFPPTQRWTAGAAMTRNGIICALGRALVVIEAGVRSGTLNAGRQALRINRAVYALQFGDDAPAGNRALFDAGARCLRTSGELGAELTRIGTQAAPPALPT